MSLSLAPSEQCLLGGGGQVGHCLEEEEEHQGEVEEDQGGEEEEDQEEEGEEGVEQVHPNLQAKYMPGMARDRSGWTSLLPSTA